MAEAKWDTLPQEILCMVVDRVLKRDFDAGLVAVVSMMCTCRDWRRRLGCLTPSLFAQGEPALDTLELLLISALSFSNSEMLYKAVISSDLQLVMLCLDLGARLDPDPWLPVVYYWHVACARDNIVMARYLQKRCKLRFTDSDYRLAAQPSKRASTLRYLKRFTGISADHLSLNSLLSSCEPDADVMSARVEKVARLFVALEEYGLVLEPGDQHRVVKFLLDNHCVGQRDGTVAHFQRLLTGGYLTVDVIASRVRWFMQCTKGNDTSIRDPVIARLLNLGGMPDYYNRDNGVSAHVLWLCASQTGYPLTAAVLAAAVDPWHAPRVRLADSQ
jgi:hypothetical protein